MIISKANIQDAVALANLINSAYRGEYALQGWTTEAELLDGTRTDAALVEEIISKPGCMMLKAEDDQRLVGCAELRQEGAKLYLGMLTVEPGLQGKGIGKALMRAAEDEAGKLKCAAIFMTVISVRTELIAWYMRHGYHDTGVRKPFAATDPRLGQPRRMLEFAVLEKKVV